MSRSWQKRFWNVAVDGSSGLPATVGRFVRRIAPSVAVLLVVLVCAAPAQARALLPAEQSLFDALNSARITRGVRPLRVDWELRAAARAHSAEMLRRDYFGHGDFSWRMGHYGVEGPAFGENLAWGVGSAAGAQAVVRMWLASPAHRAILLRAGFRRVGVAAPLGEFLGYAGARVITVDFAGR
jgi:uncharacterized protein YkwD